MPDLYRPATDTDTSYCGCSLPMGAFGVHGWHWMRGTQALLYDLEKRKFAAERPGWSQQALREAWDSWMERETLGGRVDRSGMHEAWKPYIGIPFAMEPCPAYRRVVREELEGEKRRKAFTGKRKRILGEDDE